MHTPEERECEDLIPELEVGPSRSTVNSFRQWECWELFLLTTTSCTPLCPECYFECHHKSFNSYFNNDTEY